MEVVGDGRRKGIGGRSRGDWVGGKSGRGRV